MNYAFIKSVIGGTWHVNAQTYFELIQLRSLILTTGMEFEKNEPDASSLPYYIAAEDYRRFDIETAPESDEYVAVTVLSGPMTKHDQYCGPMGTQRLISLMLRSDRKKNVIGHILYVDSGGGQSISLDPFREEFHNLTKPVVGFAENMAASAAMGAISFCAEIYASKAKAVLGSIGTMIAFDGYKANSTSADGVTHVRQYASKSVKKNDVFESALNGNHKPLIERTLNPINEDFIAMIQSNRPAITDAMCDGQDHYAEDVVGTLIDGIQSFKATVSRVIELARQNNQPNNNSQNNNIMGENNLQVLAAVAGLTTLEVDSSGHVSLQQAAAEKVNNGLKGIADAVKAKNKFEADLKQAQAKIAEQEKTIAELREENEKLGKEPGASSSTAHTTGDDAKADALAIFSVETDASMDDILNALKTID